MPVSGEDKGEVPVRAIKEVPSLVKDPEILKARRVQIIEAAVGLFTAQGFHKTTTRQIASAAGMGVGSLYEYVRSKEDILYLVCDHIHGRVEERMHNSISAAKTGRQALAQAMAAYFTVCDALSDHILLIYQEAKSLTPEARAYVLANETRITGLFREIIDQGRADGSLVIPNGDEADLAAHDIAVLGHMWTFRRWHLARRHSLADFTKYQTELILKALSRGDIENCNVKRSQMSLGDKDHAS